MNYMIYECIEYMKYDAYLNMRLWKRFHERMWLAHESSCILFPLISKLTCHLISLFSDS